MIFKDMHTLFTDNLKESKLNQKDSQVVELYPNYNSTVDIYTYKCLPKRQDDAYPPQYVVSFNPPLLVSNYNFSPLEIR